MGSNDTSAGFSDEWFKATRWTLIVAAQTSDPVRRREALGAIIEQYRGPVCAYLRRRWPGKAGTADDTEDMAQDFFEEVVLRRDLIQLADRARGRFRSFLLLALNRFAISRHRKSGRKKRKPAGKLLSIDAPGAAEPVDFATPEGAFLRAWASELLDRVIADVEDACLQAGKEKHWKVFRAMVLGPLLDNIAPPSIQAVCKKFRIADPKTAHNMKVTVQRRFRRALASRIRPQVAREEDIEAEIQDMIQILSAAGAET